MVIHLIETTTTISIYGPRTPNENALKLVIISQWLINYCPIPTVVDNSFNNENDEPDHLRIFDI